MTKGSPNDVLPAPARSWLAGLGIEPGDDALWLMALTHGSFGAKRDYERLEFLGDRVLGLAIADWLYERGTGAEGNLSQRLNVLVSGRTCAAIARDIGVPPHVRLGKQARDDGGADSDNILGDVMESLLGASFIERGFDATAATIRTIWDHAVSSDAGTVKHPKSALQEWAAGNRRKSPEYAIVNRSGPDHKASFTVRVSVLNVGEAEAVAPSKSAAERAAAKRFMELYG